MLRPAFIWEAIEHCFVRCVVLGKVFQVLRVCLWLLKVGPNAQQNSPTVDYMYCRSTTV